jgi:C4-dicarboxylate-specific signal transduction histidine kinase
MTALVEQYARPVEPDRLDRDSLLQTTAELRAQIETLEVRVRQGEERRRALLHIMGDLNETNKRLSDQRKAMIHILSDYEKDRSRLARQTERLDNSRRALLHILQDSHKSNLRLANSRKALIHLMDDLRKTTAAIERREQELRDKQEQLVQAGKLAPLGELTTGVAHELNNPLNNIGLFIGNVIDHVDLGMGDRDWVLRELNSAVQQVRKATEIISHLRTFGRVATVSHEPVSIQEVVSRALSLMSEQFRLRQIEVELAMDGTGPVVFGNSIQLEQVFINLLTNARDAVADSARKRIRVECVIRDPNVELRLSDTGPGIPPGLERRIFDPFFTTKEVGAGTGLGLSITYGIIKEHQGAITVTSPPGGGASFLIQLPLAGEDTQHPTPWVRGRTAP